MIERNQAIWRYDYSNVRPHSALENRNPARERRAFLQDGSGTSLVLATHAAKLASERKTVLVVTFNITFLHYLRDLVVRGASQKGWMENVTFVHFHDWCKRICKAPPFLDEYLDHYGPHKKDRTQRKPRR